MAVLTRTQVLDLMAEREKLDRDLARRLKAMEVNVKAAQDTADTTIRTEQASYRTAITTSQARLDAIERDLEANA